MIYSHFVDYQFVDLWFINLWFVYTLNTKTSYSWLTKPKTLKLNAKTGGSAPQNPPKLFVASYIIDELQVDESIVDKPKTSLIYLYE